MRNCLLPLVLSLAGGAAWAVPPQHVAIVYEVRHNGTVVAEVTQRLEHDGRRYTLQEEWKGAGIYALAGSALRTSRGRVVRDGLRPAEYRDTRRGRERRHATFDPGDDAPTLSRQDRLSFVWSFAFAPPSEPVSVAVADGKGVVRYAYRPAGRERLRIPAGEFETLRLVKRPADPGGGRIDEIWLATDRDDLPVRIRVTEKDGTRVDQVAVRVSAP
jgi:hypothetical protein